MQFSPERYFVYGTTDVDRADIICLMNPASNLFAMSDNVLWINHIWKDHRILIESLTQASSVNFLSGDLLKDLKGMRNIEVLSDKDVNEVVRGFQETYERIARFEQKVSTVPVQRWICLFVENDLDHIIRLALAENGREIQGNQGICKKVESKKKEMLGYLENGYLDLLELSVKTLMMAAKHQYNQCSKQKHQDLLSLRRLNLKKAVLGARHIGQKVMVLLEGTHMIDDEMKEFLLANHSLVVCSRRLQYVHQSIKERFQELKRLSLPQAKSESSLKSSQQDLPPLNPSGLRKCPTVRNSLADLAEKLHFSDT